MSFAKASSHSFDPSAAHPFFGFSPQLTVRANGPFSLGMHLNARGGISILELAIYAPSLFVAFFVCHRHGFGRSSGFIFTLILCLVRIIGAGCQLATYHGRPSNGLLEATIILDSIGLSPLLLATLGLLSRCIDSVSQIASTPFNALHLRALQLLITVGLILNIVGGTNSISSSGVYQKQTTSEVGIVLYVVAYVALVLVTLITAPKLLKGVTTSKRIMLAVILALPLILVRLIYSLLVVFHHGYDFNTISGSVVVWALMAVMEEILVVLIYLFVGWTSEAVPMEVRGPVASRPWKGNLANGAGRVGARGRMRQGPIHGLVVKHDVEKAATNGATTDDPAPGYFTTNDPSTDYRTTNLATSYPAKNDPTSNGMTTNGPTSDGNTANSPAMNTPTMNTTRRGGRRMLRQGPIHALVGMAVDAARGNKDGEKA